MNNETQAQPERLLITLEGDDGKSYKCEVLNRFEFEAQEYALLLKLPDDQEAEPKEADDRSLVIMRFFERDNQAVFQTIESDEEFDKVVAHIEELARQVQAQMAREENL